MDSGGRGGPKVEDSNLIRNNKADTSRVQDSVDNQQEQITRADSSKAEASIIREEDFFHAPEIPEYYTKVAESKFPIKAEDFFNLFFSNDAIDFVESFHTKCGDKDFSCNQWHPHEMLGHAREISFQHPIKVYFGAKYGGCKEVQSFQAYRNSRIIVSTSQEVSDVPYADYFQVEGKWDIQRDRDQPKDGCILQVHINVSFSKRTVWKGKIEQSTKEECREAYATWIELAHDVLKQRNLEEKTEDPTNALESEPALPEGDEQIAEPLGSLQEEYTLARNTSPENIGRHQESKPALQVTFFDVTTFASSLRAMPSKFYSLLESEGNGWILHVLVFAIIFVLMQLSIVILLGRPQQVYVVPQADAANGGLGFKGYQREAEVVPWLERRILLLKDEMLVVESQLERMKNEHRLIKAHLRDLEQLSRKQTDTRS